DAVEQEDGEELPAGPVRQGLVGAEGAGVLVEPAQGGLGGGSDAAHGGFVGCGQYTYANYTTRTPALGLGHRAFGRSGRPAPGTLCSAGAWRLPRRAPTVTAA